MIRVLIVDDSPTLRGFVRAVLESDPELQVVGEACDGEEAIVLCHRLEPDIVTMDIRMPGMDGYQAIRRIMAESARPIVVLTSTESDLELGITFKAVEAGALMVVDKPRGLPDQNPDSKRLIAQVKTMAEVKVVHRRWGLQRAPRTPFRTPEQPAASSRGPVRLIVIGASTGGPPALQVVLNGLPADLRVPVVVVQHISDGFVHSLTRWLDETTRLQVKVTEAPEPLRPGTAYLAPDGRHMLAMGNGLTRLGTSSPVDGHCPSATALFESAAQNYGASAVGVLLTGMGRDGARGLKALHDAGGHTIAQDEATCVVFGMPREAIALGAAGEVLPIEVIGARLAELVAVQKEV